MEGAPRIMSMMAMLRRYVAQNGAGAGSSRRDTTPSFDSAAVRRSWRCCRHACHSSRTSDREEHARADASQEGRVKHHERHIVGSTLVLLFTAALQVRHGEHGFLGVAVEHVIDAGTLGA